MLKNLIQVQKINAQIQEIERNYPQVPAWWNKSVMIIDEDNIPSKTKSQLNSIIEKKWDIESDIAERAKELVKGDIVMYLDNNTNTIKEAVVVRQGVYHNDCNDHSDFVRIENSTHAWYQSHESIVNSNYEIARIS